MFCKHCGQPVNPKEAVCKGCGQPFSVYTDNPVPSQAGANHADRPSQGNQMPQAPDSFQQPPQKQTPNGNRPQGYAPRGYGAAPAKEEE